MKRSRHPVKKNAGGSVGTLAGAALGTVIPGVGTAIGASLGGAAGSIIGGLFGKKKKEPEIPATVGRTFKASYGFKTGGEVNPPWGEAGFARASSLPGVGPSSVKIGGRSHEAGGVSLAPLGRPDVEVERGEVLTTNEAGEPEYVFSSIRMTDKPRTFAEEYERIISKGNEDPREVKLLMMKQEEQMGRKKQTTVSDSSRAAEFSKNGGSLKTGGAMPGYSPRKSSMKYGGAFKKRYKSSVHKMDPGGPIPGVRSNIEFDVTAPGNSMFAPAPAPTMVSNYDNIYDFSDKSVTVPSRENLGTVEEGLAKVAPQVEEANIISETPAGGGGSAIETAGKLAPYVADLFNIGVAATMDDPKKPRRVTPTMMDTRVSTVAEEEALTTQARAIIGNPNASTAEKLAASAQLQRARSQVRSEANRREDAIRRDNVQTLNRSQEVNARIGERHLDRVAQHEGAKATAVSAGVRSIADRIERTGAEKRAFEMQPLALTAVMHSMPTEQRRAYIQDLMNSLPPGHSQRRQFSAMLTGGV